MHCAKCGAENDDNNFKCTQCGEFLHPTPSHVVVTSDGTLGGMIPTKNPAALAAYYLGIFSTIPLLGVPLGIAAVVLGIKALRKARERPEVKGKIHAWVGIIGACSNPLYVILFVLFVAHSGRS